MFKSNERNWRQSILGQADFYRHTPPRPRTDPGFPWQLVNPNSSLRSYLRRILPVRVAVRKARSFLGVRTIEPITPQQWFMENGGELWKTRMMFKDDLSRMLFDATLVLRMTDHRQFFFPRLDFDDLLEVVAEQPFPEIDLPRHYIGLPLSLFGLRLLDRPDAETLHMLVSREALSLLNSYRQYLIRRVFMDFSPRPGEVVLDCGACIGDMSLIFGGLVGIKGEVHLFDPIPLHTRFCEYQASLNPFLSQVFHINTLAVSSHSFKAEGGLKSNTDSISPGGLAIDTFNATSLDDYVRSRNLKRVDFIKMDIEGAEMEAIDGAVETIHKFTPRLAISVYHKPDDLWQIPMKLRDLNPAYEFCYGHHSPVSWESVIYAFCP